MLCHVIIKDRELIGFYFDKKTENSAKNIHQNLIAPNDDLFVWDKEINTDGLGSSVQQSPLMWELLIDGHHYGTYKTISMACDIACRLRAFIFEGMSVVIVPYKDEMALYDQIFMKPPFEEVRKEVADLFDQLVSINCTGPCIICPARIPKHEKSTCVALLKQEKSFRSLYATKKRKINKYFP